MITTFGKKTDGAAGGKTAAFGPDLGQHIAFIRSMLDKYEWEESTRKHIRAGLSEIIKKQEDKLLSLCVVGEFSSGKSTFINALLRRDDLLVSSALQGTTVAATVLEDSRNYRLILEYRDGRSEKRYFTDASQLRGSLPEYTTDPEKAKDIKYVRIGLPAKNLTRGFRVIDTPGTNSTDPMHERITAATIKERADMSILIIDAGKPLSETFCSFIKMNFSKEALDNCIFMVTRIDMIRKREREGVLCFLCDKISAEFGIDEPVLLPFASTHVLDCMDKSEDEMTELARMSLASEDTMLLCMAKKKEAAQRKKLMSLADELYKSLSEKLSALSGAHSEKLGKLMESRSAELEPFTREQIRIRTAGYTEKTSRKHLEIRAKLDGYIETATKNMMRRANTVNTSEEIRAFLKLRLSAACTAEKQQLTKAAQRKFSLIGECFEAEMDVFRQEFDRLFGNLVSVGTSPAIIKHTFPPVPDLCVADAGSVFSEIAEAVMPYARGRDAKKNVMRKLEPEIRKYFEGVCNETERRLEEYINTIGGTISSGINAYLGIYRDAAQKRLNAEKSAIEHVKDNIQSIEEDVTLAERLKAELRKELGAESFADITKKADILRSVLGDGEVSVADTTAVKNDYIAVSDEESAENAFADTETKKDGGINTDGVSDNDIKVTETAKNNHESKVEEVSAKTVKESVCSNVAKDGTSTEKCSGSSVNIELLMGIDSDESSDHAEKKAEEAKKAEDRAKSIMEKFSYGFGDK